MAARAKLIPLYTSRGEVGAFLTYPYIYSPHGEWIGWVASDRKVFSVYGYYVGEMARDGRILRPRESAELTLRRPPPPPPPPLRPPLRTPLAPLMAEIGQNVIDVLEEAPDLMPPFGSLDIGDEEA